MRCATRSKCMTVSRCSQDLILPKLSLVSAIRHTYITLFCLTFLVYLLSGKVLQLHFLINNFKESYFVFFCSYLSEKPKRYSRFLVAKLLYFLKCLSVCQFKKNLSFSAAIPDIHFY